MSFNPTARLLVRPFRTYEELANAAPEEAPTIVGGAVRLLFVIGTVVTITAAGRLSPIELGIAAVSFAYVPLAQLVAMTVALRVVSRATPIKRAFALFLAGHGPAMVNLLAMALLALVAPAASTARVLFPAVPLLVLFGLAWGSVLTYACFRSGLGIGRLRSAVGAALHVLSLVAIIVGYYIGMGQLGPQLWR